VVYPDGGGEGVGSRGLKQVAQIVKCPLSVSELVQLLNAVHF